MFYAFANVILASCVTSTKRIESKRKFLRAVESVKVSFLSKSVMARIDSGAKSSTLHAENINIKEEGGYIYAYFNTRDEDGKLIKNLKAQVSNIIKVRSSNGSISKRPVVNTKLTISGVLIETQVSLYNRSKMKYRLLIGRKTMAGKFFINPDPLD